MKLYGLIGFPLVHSYSPEYFKEKFDRDNIQAEYRAFPLENIGNIFQLLENNPSLTGFNVTVPYKQEIMLYLDKINPQAREINSVNTVVVERINGKVKLIGYNTDIIGFEQSIGPLLKERKDRNALVLGTGGTSKTVIHALNKRYIHTFQATRGDTKESEGIYNYRDLTDELIRKTTIIINTTPVGMYPKTDELPELPYDKITSNHLLFDVIYNPTQTLFLKEGLERGATVKNGYEMLVLQAENSWKIWQENQQHF